MNVAVLVGGCSPEHEISVLSARQVMAHLDHRRWRAWPVYLDRRGAWWPAAGPLAPDETWEPDHYRQGPGPLRPGAALDDLLDRGGIEVVLPVLHGPGGEDGTVQGMLELYRVPCVGSGCAASAVAMDKVRTRECLLAARVPMPDAYLPQVPLPQADAGTEIERITAAVGLPCFAKVDNSGSTLGVARVADRDDLAEFFACYRGNGRRFLAEQLVAGEEITVGVLGNSGGDLQALPPVGIYPVRDGFFTHKAKYDPRECVEEVPPRGLDAAQLDTVQRIAVQCHEALQCDGMSRADMIVGPAGPVVLEVNTIPGLTATSLLPQAAAAAGMPFGALLDRLLELALQRGAAGAGTAP